MKKVIVLLFLFIPVFIFAQHYRIKIDRTSIVFPDTDGFGDRISTVIESDSKDCYIDLQTKDGTIGVYQNGKLSNYLIKNLFKKNESESFTEFLFNAVRLDGVVNVPVKIRLFDYNSTSNKIPMNVLIIDDGITIQILSSKSAIEKQGY